MTSKCGSFHVNICFVLVSTVVATSAQCWEYPFENDVISCGELHISGPMGIHLMNPYHPCPWVYFIFLSSKSSFLPFHLFCVVSIKIKCCVHVCECIYVRVKVCVCVSVRAC